jgi:hypothetical protein
VGIALATALGRNYRVVGMDHECDEKPGGISSAWPVPAAAVGALTYALEILTGIVDSTRRWR